MGGASLPTQDGCCLDRWIVNIDCARASVPVFRKVETNATFVMCPLYRNPLHDVARDAPLAPIIEPRGARIGMAHQLLHVLKRHALLQGPASRCLDSRSCPEGRTDESLIGPSPPPSEVRKLGTGSPSVSPSAHKSDMPLPPSHWLQSKDGEVGSGLYARILVLTPSLVATQHCAPSEPRTSGDSDSVH